MASISIPSKQLADQTTQCILKWKAKSTLPMSSNQIKKRSKRKVNRSRKKSVHRMRTESLRPATSVTAQTSTRPTPKTAKVCVQLKVHSVELLTVKTVHRILL